MEHRGWHAKGWLVFIQRDIEPDIDLLVQLSLHLHVETLHHEDFVVLKTCILNNCFRQTAILSAPKFQHSKL